MTFDVRQKIETVTVDGYAVDVLRPVLFVDGIECDPENGGEQCQTS